MLGVSSNCNKFKLTQKHIREFPLNHARVESLSLNPLRNFSLFRLGTDSAMEAALERRVEGIVERYIGRIETVLEVWCTFV